MGGHLNSNGRSTSNTCGCLLLALLGFLIAGCDVATSGPTATGDSTPNVGPEDDLSSQEILATLVRRYSSARTYRDRAILLLSYRMDGLLTEEPQPWSTSWTDDGQLSLEMFNSQIRADGQRLDCFIYDIDSANLDNQRLVLPYSGGNPPVATLFRDSIVQHFLGGKSELPFRENRSSEPLVPAPLSLLNGQVSCKWLQNPTQTQRLQDQVLDNKDCYVVRSLADGTTCDIWIEKATGWLTQMSLPLQLLDPKVMKSSSITDIQLLARFVGAAMDEPIADDSFALKSRPNATAVSRFVPLPEALPVESVGQTLAGLKLIRPNGKEVTHLDFDGKPTAFLWLGGENSYPAIQQMSELAEQFPVDKFHFGIIYSDSELTGTPSQPHLLSPALTAATASCELPLFYDPNLSASETLAIRSIPSVVVLDGDTRVQFAATAIGTVWKKDLEAALRRVAAGDDVGQEMISQYQMFVRDYHQKLAAVDATEFLPMAIRPAKSARAGQQQNALSKLPARGDTEASFVPKLLWTNDDFQEPGNIALHPGVIGKQSRSVPCATVLDGFRTVVTLDESGRVVGRKELDIPKGVAVTSLRSIRTTSDGDQHVHAAFSLLGKRVYLFDGAWTPLGSLPSNDLKHSGIRDVSFRFGFPVLDDDDEELGHLLATVSLADQRTFLFDLTNMGDGSTSTASQLGSVNSLAIEDGELVMQGLASADISLTERTKLKFAAIYGPQERDNDLVYSAATAMDANSQWYLVGLSRNPQRDWKVEIGSQFFDSNIEPVSRMQVKMRNVPAARTPAWAVACREGAVHVFNDAGVWLGDIQLSKPARGVALLTLENRFCVLVSTGNRVECWALE